MAEQGKTGRPSEKRKVTGIISDVFTSFGNQEATPEIIKAMGLPAEMAGYNLLEIAALAQFKKALNGDSKAFMIIAQYIQGKPAQFVTLFQARQAMEGASEEELAQVFEMPQREFQQRSLKFLETKDEPPAAPISVKEEDKGGKNG